MRQTLLYSKTGYSKEMANPNLSPLCTGVLLTTKVAMSSGLCVEQHSLDMTGKKSGLQVCNCTNFNIAWYIVN